MKRLISFLILSMLLLAACGTVTEEGIVFHTADPNLNIGFRFAPIPDLPIVEPEVVPEEEVGEIAPDPTPAPPAIVIKGNISNSGEKIYHLPGGAYYDQVKIDEAAGERFFESEEEAIAAGWRKASR